MVFRGMSLGVRVLAVDRSGRILMVRHGYTPGWHLPGGGVDYNETLEAAAARELLEETGYRCPNGMHIKGVAYNRKLWKGDHVVVFYATDLEKMADVKPGFEIAETGFFSPDDLPADTSAGTRARIVEWQAGSPISAYWNG